MLVHNYLKCVESEYFDNFMLLFIIDHSHPDIKANYNANASFDFNGEDPDPFPRDSDPYNAHGTKCSGEIAAVANNGICGVGVAYGADIGAVRMLDGKATDSLEAKSLGFKNDYIDIYSCSWGPKDDGKTFGRPAKLAKAAFIKGATEGRQGELPRALRTNAITSDEELVVETSSNFLFKGNTISSVYICTLGYKSDRYRQPPPPLPSHFRGVYEGSLLFTEFIIVESLKLSTRVFESLFSSKRILHRAIPITLQACS